MQRINSPEDGLELFKVLGSEARVEIINLLLKNKQMSNKPNGGLWASPKDAEFGWKEWCEQEHFRNCLPEDSFEFHLKFNANILRIDSVDTARDMPQRHGGMEDVMRSVFHVLPDFELIAMKYDAIDAAGTDQRELLTPLGIEKEHQFGIIDTYSFQDRRSR